MMKQIQPRLGDTARITKTIYAMNTPNTLMALTDFCLMAMRAFNQGYFLAERSTDQRGAEMQIFLLLAGCFNWLSLKYGFAN
ncbi:hypothetical protein NMG60_11012047 [Bertholletia excelsa]